MKRDPFHIPGPALISFSGGRTSAYMLRRVLDAGLQPDVHVVFANTGKEQPETLDFVQECSQRWNVPIHWVEYRPRVGDLSATELTRAKLLAEFGLPVAWALDRAGWVEVDYPTASRAGEPFEALIRKKQFLPNPVMRFCTSELKIVPMKAFMRAQGYEHWTEVIGIRADEPRRVATIRGKHEPDADHLLPLASAEVMHPEVLDFWKVQPFDLGLELWEGNCDNCFLKGINKRLRIMRDRPQSGIWWAAQEAREGGWFRKDGPRYADLIQIATRPTLFRDCELEIDDLGECTCTD